MRHGRRAWRGRRGTKIGRLRELSVTADRGCRVDAGDGRWASKLSRISGYKKEKRVQRNTRNVNKREEDYQEGVNGETSLEGIDKLHAYQVDGRRQGEVCNNCQARWRCRRIASNENWRDESPGHTVTGYLEQEEYLLGQGRTRIRFV
jgi:hypothetical protein